MVEALQKCGAHEQHHRVKLASGDNEKHERFCKGQYFKIR
jgi:hypothetical protein